DCPVGFLTSTVMAPLVLPSYWTMRINSGLVLPCSPGSLSNPVAAAAMVERTMTRPNAAKQNANRKRFIFMGHLRPRFDAPSARRIWGGAARATTYLPDRRPMRSIVAASIMAAALAAGCAATVTADAYGPDL